MAHEHHRLIRVLIWLGLYARGVETHRALYKKCPDEEFIPFLSSLYSARLYSRYRDELLDRIDQLQVFLLHPVTECAPGLPKALDRADVVSTILEWASRQQLKPAKRNYLLERADSVVQDALMYAHRIRGTHRHTYALLLLTHAQIQLRQSMEYAETMPKYATDLKNYVGMDVAEACTHAIDVSDLRQRERIYRKAGIIYRHLGNRKKASACFLQSLLVPHVAVGVKVKTMAALLAIEL